MGWLRHSPGGGLHYIPGPAFLLLTASAIALHHGAWVMHTTQKMLPGQQHWLLTPAAWPDGAAPSCRGAGPPARLQPSWILCRVECMVRAASHLASYSGGLPGCSPMPMSM